MKLAVLVIAVGACCAVGCGGAPPAATPPAATPPTTPAQPQAGWWCTHAPDALNGACDRQRAGCEGVRSSMTARQLVPCYAQPAALCFESPGPSGRPVDLCAPTLEICQHLHHVVRAAQRDATSRVTDCASTP